MTDFGALWGTTDAFREPVLSRKAKKVWLVLQPSRKEGGEEEGCVRGGRTEKNNLPSHRGVTCSSFFLSFEFHPFPPGYASDLQLGSKIRAYRSKNFYHLFFITSSM